MAPRVKPTKPSSKPYSTTASSPFRPSGAPSLKVNGGSLKASRGASLKPASSMATRTADQMNVSATGGLKSAKTSAAIKGEMAQKISADELNLLHTVAATGLTPNEFKNFIKGASAGKLMGLLGYKNQKDGLQRLEGFIDKHYGAMLDSAVMKYNRSDLRDTARLDTQSYGLRRNDDKDSIIPWYRKEYEDGKMDLQREEQLGQDLFTDFRDLLESGAPHTKIERYYRRHAPKDGESYSEKAPPKEAQGVIEADNKSDVSISTANANLSGSTSSSSSYSGGSNNGGSSGSGGNSGGGSGGGGNSNQTSNSQSTASLSPVVSSTLGGDEPISPPPAEQKEEDLQHISSTLGDGDSSSPSPDSGPDPYTHFDSTGDISAGALGGISNDYTPSTSTIPTPPPPPPPAPKPVATDKDLLLIETALSQRLTKDELVRLIKGPRNAEVLRAGGYDYGRMDVDRLVSIIEDRYDSVKTQAIGSRGRSDLYALDRPGESSTDSNFSVEAFSDNLHYVTSAGQDQQHRLDQLYSGYDYREANNLKSTELPTTPVTTTIASDKDRLFMDTMISNGLTKDDVIRTINSHHTGEIMEATIGTTNFNKADIDRLEAVVDQHYESEKVRLADKYSHPELLQDQSSEAARSLSEKGADHVIDDLNFVMDGGAQQEANLEKLLTKRSRTESSTISDSQPIPPSPPPAISSDSPVRISSNQTPSSATATEPTRTTPSSSDAPSSSPSFSPSTTTNDARQDAPSAIGSVITAAGAAANAGISTTSHAGVATTSTQSATSTDAPTLKTGGSLKTDAGSLSTGDIGGSTKAGEWKQRNQQEVAFQQQQEAGDYYTDQEIEDFFAEPPAGSSKAVVAQPHHRQHTLKETIHEQYSPTNDQHLPNQAPETGASETASGGYSTTSYSDDDLGDYSPTPTYDSAEDDSAYLAGGVGAALGGAELIDDVGAIDAMDTPAAAEGGGWMGAIGRYFGASPAYGGELPSGPAGDLGGPESVVMGGADGGAGAKESFVGSVKNEIKRDLAKSWSKKFQDYTGISKLKQKVGATGKRALRKTKIAAKRALRKTGVGRAISKYGGKAGKALGKTAGVVGKYGKWLNPKEAAKNAAKKRLKKMAMIAAKWIAKMIGKLIMGAIKLAIRLTIILAKGIWALGSWIAGLFGISTIAFFGWAAAIAIVVGSIVYFWNDIKEFLFGDDASNPSRVQGEQVVTNPNDCVKITKTASPTMIKDPTKEQKVAYTVVVEPNGTDKKNIRITNCTDTLTRKCNGDSANCSNTSSDELKAQICDTLMEGEIMGTKRSNATYDLEQGQTNYSLTNEVEITVACEKDAPEEGGESEKVEQTLKDDAVTCVGEKCAEGYCWPLSSGRISEPPCDTPNNHTSHYLKDAIDITCTFGSEIYAPFTGTFNCHNNGCPQNYKTGNKCGGGWGNYVTGVDHNGISWLLGHMTRCVETSGTVTKGTVIGYCGSTGSSTGNHLHFHSGGSSGGISCNRNNPSGSNLIQKLHGGQPWPKIGQGYSYVSGDYPNDPGSPSCH